MTGQNRSKAASRRVLALWSLLVLQTVCAAFFLADVIFDLLGMENALGGVDHHTIELIAVLALTVGIVFVALEIRKVLNRQKRMESQLKAASGAFCELLEDHFDHWSLTPSERDVATLAIKGLSIAEIAAMRETKPGTIKAQCNSIYGKAGVTGRPQLLSLFIEDLMSENLLGTRQNQNQQEQ